MFHLDTIAAIVILTAFFSAAPVIGFQLLKRVIP